MDRNKSGYKKFFAGFAFAFRGLKIGFASEINIKLHALATVIVVVAGFYFHVTYSDWLWLLAAIGMVLVAEYINTAIEKLTDIVSPEYHQQAGIVKDISAAAVLLAAIIAAAIGIVIFWPYIF